MVRCLNCMKEYEEAFGVCPYCGFVNGTPPKEVYHLYPGMILAGRYIIGTTLGFGGFGITYRAWDTKLDQMVAVKEFYPNGIVNRIPGEKEVIVYTGNRALEFRGGLQRFLDEARNMAKFSTHPNIVNVYDFFEENNTAYIVMEFLDGVSYKQYIKEQGGMAAESVAVGVVISVLDALKEIHKEKIIHRDISPDNIFICKGGVIKLIDFGAARFAAGDQEKTMSIILKPGFAPPEQYRSKSRQGPWTDIYAVGAVLYRSLTGQMPDESVNRAVDDQLKAPRELSPLISENISNAVMRAMALNQELRFQNVDQFKEALTPGAQVRDARQELDHRKKSRYLGTAVVLGAVLLGCGIGFYKVADKSSQVNLKTAEIAVWVPVGDDSEDQKELDEQDFQDMTASYSQQYPNITVKLNCIPESRYQQEINQAAEDKKLPDLFDSTYLEPEYYTQLDSLEEVYSLLPKESYYYLDQYPSYFPSQKQMPLSFQLPLIYYNDMIVTEAATASNAYTELTVDGNYSYGVNPRVLKNYEELMGDIGLKQLKEVNAKLETNPDTGGYEKFENKELGYYLSDTSDFSRMNKEMAGIYRVALMDGDFCYGRFTNLWSVSAEGSKKERTAAKRLLYYLLSGASQNILNVVNTAGIPLNKEVCGQYKSINSDFKDLDTWLARVRFDGEQQAREDKLYLEQLKEQQDGTAGGE